jgi:hypothetical protein
MLNRSSTVEIQNPALINPPITRSEHHDNIIDDNDNMSYIPTTENQRKRYSSQPMPPYTQSQTVFTPAPTYPVLAAAPGHPTMSSPRSWSQQSAVYPYIMPQQGRSNYSANTRSMGSMPPSYAAPSTAPLDNTTNTHMIRSPYVTPYPDPWNNMYDTVAPMSNDQPGWERSDLGFSGCQQHSPSRSDGSASTQVSSLSSPYTHPSPLIKLEHQPELSPYGTRYAFENTAFQQPIPTSNGPTPIISPQSHRPFTTSLVSYGQSAEHVKYDFNSYDLESLSLSGDPRVLKSGGQSKRGYTTPEEATCSCEICGTSFKRSNNLKTHMQTHAPNRSQPHKCEYEKCNRAFVRKTDLVRHEQSVSWNHQTPLMRNH